MKSKTLGVIVARFQVPDLSPGHRYLIEAALALHEKVLVVLGDSPARLTQPAPLPYALRHQMVKQAYPSVHVVRLEDQPNDATWTKKLDDLITKIVHDGEAILYGGRDSFIPHYLGTRRVILVPPHDSPSGEEIRAKLGPRHSSDFRAGVVWASRWKFPTSFQCVDMALIDVARPDRVVVARKANDLGWRFPGGFVDPADPSLEYAAKRESREETGVEPGDPKYVGSFRIDDYRYRKAKDGILTALFVVPVLWGYPVAADDVAECKWMTLNDETRAQMLPHYVPMFDAARTYAETHDEL